MPGYISEFDYFGTDPDEFIEIAVPTGTDVSSYTLVFYQADGTIYSTVSLGSVVTTIDGQDVYVVDISNPGFDSGGDAMGMFYPDDAIALVDDSNAVLQFISWEGNTVSAIEGPASGQTSTNVGTTSGDGSLQSDDGGATYYAQSSSNKGTIPCFAAGTRILCESGEVTVEDLRPGMRVMTLQNGLQPLRWVWSGTQVPDAEDAEGALPILISAAALGGEQPKTDLIVSGQHRILMGAQNQMQQHITTPALCKAILLTQFPGIRIMHGKKRVKWFHLLFDRHEIIQANGCAAESLLLAPMVLERMGRRVQRQLSRALGLPAHIVPPHMTAAAPILTRRILEKQRIKERALIAEH